MDAFQEKLQLLRAQLDHIPVLQQAEVGMRIDELSLQWPTGRYVGERTPLNRGVCLFAELRAAEV